MNKEAVLYEIGYILSPLLTEDAVVAKVADIRGFVEKSGGVLFSEGEPKLQSLAYTIFKKISGQKRSFNEAYFGWVRFEADPAQVSLAKESLDIDETVIRFLLIKVDAKTLLEPKAPRIRHFPSDSGDEDRAVDGSVAKVVPVSVPVSDKDLDKELEELLTGVSS